MSEVLKVPAIGLGTFLTKDEKEVETSVVCAINSGYKLIDTAQVYDNEHIIGEVLKKNNINRNEIFITSKIANDIKTYDDTIKSFEKTCVDLQTDYIDMMLVHWPQGKIRNAEVYKALEDLFNDNKIKAIGISNFMIHHIDDLLETATIVPMMNQVELHPFLQQHELKEYCDEKGIAITSYGPFAKGKVFENTTLKEIAIKHEVSVSQVVVKWGIQRGIFMIPKSVTEKRIKINNDVEKFDLDDKDMKKIRKLNEGKREYKSPDNLDY